MSNWAVCIHESSHCVAAARFSIPLYYATITPKGTSSGHVSPGIGYTEWQRRPFPDSRMETFEFRAEFVAYLAAGNLAEQQIAEGRTEQPASGEAVRQWFEAQGGTDYTQARKMVDAIDYWPRADKLLLAAFKLAQRVVTEDRHAIKTLARELQQRERLTVQEMRPIVMAAIT